MRRQKSPAASHIKSHLPSSPHHTVINLHLFCSCPISFSHLGSPPPPPPPLGSPSSLLPRCVKGLSGSRRVSAGLGQSSQSRVFTAIAGNGARQAEDVLQPPPPPPPPPPRPTHSHRRCHFNVLVPLPPPVPPNKKHSNRYGLTPDPSITLVTQSELEYPPPHAGVETGAEEGFCS